MATETSEGLLPQIPSAAGRRPLFVCPLPAYAYVGVLLNGLSWVSSWARIGPWAYTFFPLWLGFILLLDGLNVARTGTSPLRRSWKRFVLLFVYSSPFWWAFEALNIPVQNWHYQFDHPYSLVAYIVITSLDFSTVLPAVMELVELVAGFAPLRPRLDALDPGPLATRRLVTVLLGLGAVMVILPFLFPRYAFGALWLCLIFLLDPINNRARRKSALGHLLAGDWRFFVTVPLATLICGFFWEMWNSRALPGWWYSVPLVGAAPHLFAMPLPGYLGYLPFGIELFAMYQFALWLTRQRRDALAF